MASCGSFPVSCGILLLLDWFMSEVLKHLDMKSHHFKYGHLLSMLHLFSWLENINAYLQPDWVLYNCTMCTWLPISLHSGTHPLRYLMMTWILSVFDHHPYQNLSLIVSLSICDTICDIVLWNGKRIALSIVDQ